MTPPSNLLWVNLVVGNLAGDVLYARRGPAFDDFYRDDLLLLRLKRVTDADIGGPIVNSDDERSSHFGIIQSCLWEMAWEQGQSNNFLLNNLKL